jgi:hypothetical protein
VTVALIAALVVTVAAFVVLLDRKDKRAHAEREAQRAETQVLLQRIQAPELAVVEHQVQQAVEAPQPPQTDDEFWHLSDDHLRMVAELEARENAPFDRV